MFRHIKIFLQEYNIKSATPYEILENSENTQKKSEKKVTMNMTGPP